jgi:hypothetical protein
MNKDNTQDKPKRSAALYFTVRTTASGISDQLANQLRTLYTVGIMCGYEYAHDPPSFQRSWHPKVYKLRSALNKAERLLFLQCGRPRIPAYRVIATVQHALSRLEGFSAALFHEDLAVARFLGFDRFDYLITDKRFSTYTVIDVPFDKILTSRAISDIQQLRAAIGDLSTSQSVIYAFSAGPIYPYLPRLRALLAASGGDAENFNFLGFPGRYWEARNRWPVHLPAPQDKINVVIHIRRGDSIAIDLGSRRICLHGGLMTDELFEKILENDPGRQVDIGEYKDTVNRMFSEFGPDNFACTLISDGYEQTYSLIIKAIHRGLLRPDSQELEKLKAFLRSSDRELMELARQMNAFPYSR